MRANPDLEALCSLFFMCMHFTLFHEFRLALPRVIHHELLMKHSFALEQKTRNQVSRALKRLYSCPLSGAIVTTHTRIHIIGSCIKFMFCTEGQNLTKIWNLTLKLIKDFMKVIHAFLFKSPPTKLPPAIAHINDSIM